MNTGNNNFCQVVNRVQEALEEYFIKEKGEEIKSFDVIKTIQRTFSSVLFIQVYTSSSSYKFVVKSIIHHEINKSITKKENQAVVEFNILQDLYPQFSGLENCSVPLPILVLPDIETYVMEFVEGGMLTDDFKYARYLSSNKRFRSLQKHMFLCGKWLKHFQNITGNIAGEVQSLQGIIDRCEHRLRLIDEASDPRCPSNLREKVMELIQEQLELLSGQEILLCGRHSDFTPFNILAGRDGITVIDFLGYGMDALPVDVLKMLVYLEDEKLSLTSNSRRVEILKESFIEGYGGLPPIQRELFIISEILQRVVSLWGNLSYQVRLPHHKIDANTRIRAHLNWLLNEKSQAMWYC